MTTLDLKEFPTHRIKAVDGMAITADIWDQAHDYTRQLLRQHQRWQHGAGIVAGLDVIASDPPDSAVYIQPGVAVDAYGNVIVVTHAQSFDLGAAQGTLHLMLSYTEDSPRIDGSRSEGVPYVAAQYSIEAVEAISGSGIELARVRRSGASPITNAPAPDQPGPNAIDLRYRRSIVTAAPRVVTIGVNYLGSANDRRHGAGLSGLARAINQTDRVRVIVDDNIGLTSDLAQYTLLYLVGHGTFQVAPEGMNAIYAYLQAGGTVLYESCHQGEAAKADAAFLDLLASLGQKIDELPRTHPLLAAPHFFAVPPIGYEAGKGGSVKLSSSVIFSGSDYGCVWQGERRDGPADRADIRSALEFGENIVTYAVQRKV